MLCLGIKKIDMNIEAIIKRIDEAKRTPNFDEQDTVEWQYD